MEYCTNSNTNLSKFGTFLKCNKKRNLNLYKYYSVALVGNPNVGKSVIFNSLTGAYVTVSNYPGTTIDISRGSYIYGNSKIDIADTPGMYSMIPLTEEEAVSRRMLMEEFPDLIIHVVDAKNIQRMLPLTLQLIEANFNVILLLNIMDEARSCGIYFNTKLLSAKLGIPVLTSTAALDEGILELKNEISRQHQKATLKMKVGV